MNVISHKNLPNADFRTVGIIPLRNLFPVEATIQNGKNAYIHYDGSLVRFFELFSVNTKTLSNAIKNLPPSSSMQIYRYHTPVVDKYYLSLRADINYANMIPYSIFHRFKFNPLKFEVENISNLTKTAFEKLDEVIKDVDVEDADFFNSQLAHLLFDFTLENNTIHGNQVRTNFSLLKIGESHYATLASLNNMTQIPSVTSCCSKDHTYIERIVLVSPSENRKKELSKKVLENAKFIECLKQKKESNNSVDTLSYKLGDVFPKDENILYSDVTFFLFSDTVPSLIKKIQKFHDCMEENDIALYCHTNTSRSSYISLFPGNEVYGERYTILFEYFLDVLIWKVLEL